MCIFRRIILAVALLCAADAARAAEPLTFVAFGDAPYGLPGDEGRFLQVVEEANRINPAFVVHIGDIKSGSSSCDDSMFVYIQDLFRRFEPPLIYTPGDNEWTDCHRFLAGRFNPVERLDRLRQLFFPDDLSLGRTRIKLTRQADFSDTPADHRIFVENALWDRAGIQFATVHVVGSGNNFSHDPVERAEYVRRNGANLAWLDRVFRRAAETGSRAVVLFMHADPLFEATGDRRIGFVDTLRAFSHHARAFPRPILLVHGDNHTYLVDRPLRSDPIRHSGPVLQNFTRLEVFGSPETRGVIVTVTTDERRPFHIRPMVMPYDVLPGSNRP
jgi:hypothetical protein